MLAYTYVGYPVVLYIISMWHDEPYAGARELTGLSVIIPAYNEEHIIEKRIQNILAAKYPQYRVEIIVVSDASTDRTNEIVQGFGRQGVKLIVNPERKGKTYGLNRAVESAQYPILVFTDSNAMFEPSALSSMVKWFANPSVGLVTGSTKYFSENEFGQVAVNMDFYTKFERWIKTNESRVRSCVGADGAIFAMRKSLYRALDVTDINDLVLPLDVVRQGFRVMLDTEAFCLEEHATTSAKEYQRQVRIAVRTIRALIHHRDLFNLFEYGAYSWMLLSHKLLRFIFPWTSILFVFLNILLLFSGSYFYTISFICLLMIILLPLVSFRKENNSRLLFFLRSFMDLNLAILTGWIMVFRGDTFATWGENGKN